MTENHTKKLLVQALRHTSALCLSMSNMIHDGINFLLPNELKRRLWSILGGFMGVRDLKIWVSWHSRTCQWLLGRTQQHKKEKNGTWGWFFSGVGKHDAINTRYYKRQMAWQMLWKKKKRKDLLLGEPEKNKQEGQREKYTSSPLLSKTSSRSCKTSNCIPQDCTLQRQSHPLSPLIALLEFMAILLRRLIFVYWISKEERKAKSNLIHDAKILWECYCWFFSGSVASIWYSEPRWNSHKFILEMFPLNILS